MTNPNTKDQANDAALLQTAFDRVVARISSTPSDSSSSSSIDNTTKLRLYALYKYGTVGPPTTTSNSWSPTAVAKDRAWQQIGETIDHDPQRAKIEYLQLAASLDETCRQLLEEYQHQLNTDKTETIDPTDNAASEGCDTLPFASKERPTLHAPEAAKDQTHRIATDPPLALFLIVWNFLIEIIARHLPQPVIPRGGLDISWADLGFALMACIQAFFFGGGILGYGATARRQQLEEDTVTKIVDLCLGKASNKDNPKIDNNKNKQSNEHANVDVVVGYTVRSLLDLYLMHKQYPPQASKEVIVSPPITIPGMVQLLEHYGLVVVPVEGQRDENVITRIDVDVIEAAVTDRTVAIMIVHPFGATSASSEEWARLRVLANEQSIELWEDAAESYRGLATDNTDSSNHESTEEQSEEILEYSTPHADITFVSFGLIKTATALGGGIALIRDHRQQQHLTSARTLQQDLSTPRAAAVAMRRLQQHHYVQQTAWDYCSGKVLPTFLIQVFSLHPRLYGAFASLCVQWGGYDCFDQMVTRNVRSIVPSGSRSSSTTIHWMELIRKRPSLPLLQLLHRRLLHSRDTCCRVERRIQQCQNMTKIFQVHTLGVGVPSATSLSSTYWLYPIQVDPTKKQLVQERLLKFGWDIAAGTSQLQCVLPTLSTSDVPFKTKDFMSNVLYLPVASRSLTRQQCMSLAKDIQRTLEVKSNDLSNNSPKHVQEKGRSFSLFGICMAMWFLPLIVASAIMLLGYGIACTVCVGYCLQWLCGTMYLESSNGFAHYISMLGAKSPTKNRAERNQNEDANTLQDPPDSKSNTGVIDSITALQLPEVPRLSEKGDFRGYAILTGATGFCGSLILRDLLLHRKRLNLLAGVYVICRSKRSKSAEQRVADLLQEDMFSFLSQAERSNLVHVLEGDVTKLNASLSDQDLEILQMLPAQNAVLTHVIHAAASVSFTQEMEDAAKTNIAAALNMQALTKRLGQMLEEHEITKNARTPAFVHISTAFVHGAGSGTKEEPLPQELFSLEPYQPVKLFESMLGTQFYASKAMSDLRFTNTYAFTKCICEHLLIQRSHESQLAVPTIIIRPSIVGPAVENPEEGWAGQKPSTIVAAGCLYLSYQWNLWCFGSSYVPCIPVDVLSRFVLAKAFSPGHSPTEVATADTKNSIVESSSSEDSFERIPGNDSVQSLSNCSSQSQKTDTTTDFSHGAHIYTAAWNLSSDTNAMFTWLDYCGATLHMGAVWGYFYRSTAYIGLWVTSKLMPRFQLSLETYMLVHYIVVQLPMKVLLTFCRAVQWKKQAKTVSKLFSFLDLPLLFFPYMNTTFYFESDLAAPGAMCGDRYVFSCVVAAHRFVEALKRKATNSSNNRGKTSVRNSHRENAPQHPEVFLIGGKMHQHNFNLWWALTQPAGSPLIRIAGWIFAMILKATCHGLSVDLSSFELALKQRLALEKAEEKGAAVHLVLAPTHRSFFDFVILSYLVFAIPELQLSIPAIASADEFASLPVIGLLARWLGAFYIRRGRGVADPDLQATVTSKKQRGTAVFEVFIEGSRSRDRRFVTPKTGFLRSLSNSGGRHLIVPIAISYERLPEQDILAAEAASLCGKAGLKAGGLFWWLKDVYKGKVSLGRIHVAAGRASMLECKTSSDYVTLARDIQLQQQEMTVYSNYHCRAASTLLGLDLDTVRAAMNRIGCQPWPIHNSDTDVSLALTLPEDSSELCTIMLQMAHKISGLCMESHKEWALWLNCVADGGTRRKLCPVDPSTAALAQSFISILSAADTQVQRACEKLAVNGFQQPTTNHLLQTVSKDCTSQCIPAVILGAAVSIFQARNTSDNGIEDSSNTEAITCLPTSQVLLESGERLGFWGFHDSGFALQVTKKGTYKVLMRGGRYSLSGKSLSKLLPFVESETKVRINPFNEAFMSSPRGFASDGTLVGSSFSAEIMHQLQSAVSKFSLSVDDRVRHGTGQSQEDIFAIRNRLDENFRIPDAVVWPTSEAEVNELISLAKLEKLCLIPFGGGTNVSNATRCPSKDVEPRPILSVDMSKMNRLLWLNEEDGLACVEAGINGRDLVDALKRRGHTMGHEPDSYEFSTLGGWIATKASGMKRNKYGNIEDIVRDIRVAASDGLVSEKSKNDTNLKSAFGRESCGMDFRSLFLGSEGCLGIITSAIVKVWPLPETQEYDSVLLTRFSQGLSFVRDIAKLDRMVPVSVRLLDNEHFRLGQALRADPSSAFESMAHSVQKMIASISMSTFDPKSVVCTTICYEGSRIEVQQQKAAVLQLAKRHGGISLGPSIGRAGYDLTFMIAYLRDFAMTYHFLGESFETFAPWSKVESIIQNTKKRIQKEHNDRSLPGIPFVGCRVTQLYHDGACLYFYFCMNTQNVKDASQVFAEIEHAARAEIMQSGGSLSHHHGVGKVRAEFLRETTSPAFQKIVSNIKGSMDPENIFAAGNGLFGVE